MNVSLPIFSPRSLLVLLAFGVMGVLQGQTSNAYKQLETKVGQWVADTVSGTALTVYMTNNGNNGTANITLISGSGNPRIFRIKYQPNAGFIGRDTFVVELNYNNAQTFPYLRYQAYQVSVYPSLVRSRPDFVVTPLNTNVDISVLNNDSGTDLPLAITEIPLVNNGTANINSNGTVTFSPATDFSGIAHLNYVVCDAVGNCKTEAVSVSVSDASPLSDSLHIATSKNTSVTIPLTFNGYSVFQAPAHGTVNLQGGFVFKYMPQANYSGADQFVLSTVIGGQTYFKHVFITVVNTPEPNKMAMDDYTYTPKNIAASFNLLENDILNPNVVKVRGLVIPQNFPGTINSWQQNGNIQFTPNQGFSGVAEFKYYVGTTAHPNLETASVSVLVGNMNPAQGIFNMVTPEETPLVINYQIPFLGFDFAVLDQPDNGTLALHQGFTTLTINGQTISGYNLLVYTPFAGYLGADEFELNYCITATNQCQSVKVEVEVVDINSSASPFCLDDCVWSGDINYDGIVNNKDLLPLGYFMGFDGTLRDDAAMEWYGQYGDDWSNPYSGYPIDLKHVDTDGDGQISTEDTTAISEFYGKTHNLIPGIVPSNKGLPFFLNPIVLPNPLEVGDYVEIEVALGNTNNPVSNVYGFAYDVKLSPQIKDTLLQMQFYNNSWFNLNAPSINLQKRPRVGKLETAITRTNGVSSTGFGKIGKLSFIVDDFILSGKPGGDFSISLSLENASAIFGDGSVHPMKDCSIEIPVRISQYPIPATEVKDKDLFVFPNPASDLMQIHLNGQNQIRSLSIVNTMGMEVWNSGQVEWKHSEINVSNLPNGIYFAVAYTDAGRVTKKFEILK